MSDLRNSLNNLLDHYHVYNDDERYQLIYESIKELYEEMPDKREELKLLLFDEGIKRLAGI